MNMYSSKLRGNIGFITENAHNDKIIPYIFNYLYHRIDGTFYNGIIGLSKHEILNSTNNYYINTYIKRRKPHAKIYETDEEMVKDILKAAREYIVGNFGTGTNLCGHCIEASVLIKNLLKIAKLGNAEIIEGWIEYDCKDYGSSRPWDAHTWVKWKNYILDITADQFNVGMYPENELLEIIMQDTLPHGYRLDEPEWDTI